MSSRQNRTLAIQWHEGMLLSPHHFQQHDLRWQADLHLLSSQLSPFPWGVLEFSIDEGALKEGTLRVLTLAGIFPDGLAFDYSAAEDSELKAPLAPYLDSLSAGPLLVHVAICGLHIGENLLAGELARYESVEVKGTVDINTGESELTIPRLRPKLELRIEERPPAKFVSLPLARITYQNGQFAFADYVPPLLRVEESSLLGRLCSNVIRTLREKAADLVEKIRAPSAAERPPQSLEHRLVLHALSAGLPPLDALLMTNRAHPFALYLALCGVLGQVAVLGGNQQTPLQSYNHNDPLPSFAELCRIVLAAADKGAPQTYSAHPFQLDSENDTFRLLFDPSWAGRPFILGVRSRPGISEKESVEWVESALIGSHSRLPDLRKIRVRGAQRQRIDSAGELVPGSDVTLWTIAAGEPINPGEMLEIRNLDFGGQRRPVEIVLYWRKGG